MFYVNCECNVEKRKLNTAWTDLALGLAFGMFPLSGTGISVQAGQGLESAHLSAAQHAADVFALHLLIKMV